MTRKTALVIALFIISINLYALQLSAPAEIRQGYVVTVVADEKDTELYFKRGDEIYSQSRTFEASVGGKSVFIALLGVPSTATPGAYQTSGTGAVLDLTVIEAEFIQEDIPLSRTMSSLRQSDDEEKYEQWRRLLNILKTVNTEHIYTQSGFKVPVEDYLRESSFYGDRRRFLYDDGTSASSIHNGIDYSAEPGTPVTAAAGGRVVFSGERIISGNTVVIEHLPGVYSLYYHMNSLNAAENQMVERGDLIGTVGATGLATGAHLHWEIRVGGVAVNPAGMMLDSMIDKDFIISKME